MLKLYNNTNNIEKIDNYTVKFTLHEFNPYVPSFMGPILSKAEMGDIPFSEWSTHPTNTETTPIGFGPYMFSPTGYDMIDTVHLAPNPYYNASLMGHNPNAIGGGIWCPEPAMTNVTIKSVKDARTAYAGLNNSLFDIIDAYTVSIGDATTIEMINNSKIITTLPFSFQEIVYNQYSPIWGMNPGDPRVMYPGDYPSPIDLFLDQFGHQISAFFIFIVFIILFIVNRRFRR